MDAKQLNDLLVDYLYGELDQQQRAAFEEGLRRHPEVQLELEALQRTRSVFAELESLEPPAALTERLLAEASKRAPGQSRQDLLSRLRSALQLLIVHPAVPAAAMLVAVLGVSLYVYQRSAPSEQLEPRGVVGDEAPAVVAASPSAASLEAERVYDRRPTAAVEAAPEEPGPSDGEKGGGARAVVSRSRRPAVASPKKTYVRKERVAKRKRRARKKQAPRELDALTGLAANKDSSRDKLGDLGADEIKAPTAKPTAPQRALSRAPSAQQQRRYAQPPPASELASAAGRAAPAETTSAQDTWQRGASTNDDRAQEDRAAQRDEKSEAGRQAVAKKWIRRAIEATKAKKCDQALAYYERAVRASERVAALAEGQLGICEPLLTKQAKLYPVLTRSVRRVRSARARRAASERAKATRSVIEKKADTATTESR